MVIVLRTFYKVLILTRTLETFLENSRIFEILVQNFLANLIEICGAANKSKVYLTALKVLQNESFGIASKTKKEAERS